MIKNDFIIPALIGFGLYAKNNEMCLANDTTILLLAVLILQDHAKIQHLQREVKHIRHRFDCIHGVECCCECDRDRDHHHQHDHRRF